MASVTHRMLGKRRFADRPIHSQSQSFRGLDSLRRQYSKDDGKLELDNRHVIFFSIKTNGEVRRPRTNWPRFGLSANRPVTQACIICMTGIHLTYKAELTVEGLLRVVAWVHSDHNDASIGAETWCSPTSSLVTERNLARHATLLVGHRFSSRHRGAHHCSATSRLWRRRRVRSRHCLGHDDRDDKLLYLAQRLLDLQAWWCIAGDDLLLCRDKSSASAAGCAL